MTCKNSNRNCGCREKAVTLGSGTPCNEEPCSEFFSADCIIYNGEEMSLGEFKVSKGERMSCILQRLISYSINQAADIPTVRISSITEDSARVHVGEHEEQYTVSYKDVCEEDWHEKIIGADIDSIIISDLNPSADYELKVSDSQNESLIFKFKTL